jgi:hypothetical protein
LTERLLVGRDIFAKRDLRSAGLLVYDRERRAILKSRPCIKVPKRSADETVVVLLVIFTGRLSR